MRIALRGLFQRPTRIWSIRRQAYSSSRNTQTLTAVRHFHPPIMAPVAVEDIVQTPIVSKTVPQPSPNGAVNKPTIARYDANDPATTTDLLVSILERDGGVIVENIISQELASRIRTELKPYFDTDKVDPSGFFPHTTQRATGLLGRSDACVELAMNPTYIDVANRMISSTYTYWTGQEQETVTGKPIISSTVGFRVNPGGRQQALHRDDGYAYPVEAEVGPVLTARQRLSHPQL